MYTKPPRSHDPLYTCSIVEVIVGGNVCSTPLSQRLSGQAKVKEEVFYFFILFPRGNGSVDSARAISMFFTLRVSRLSCHYTAFLQPAQLVKHLIEIMNTLSTTEEEVPSLALLELVPSEQKYHMPVMIHHSCDGSTEQREHSANLRG